MNQCSGSDPDDSVLLRFDEERTEIVPGYFHPGMLGTCEVQEVVRFHPFKEV